MTTAEKVIKNKMGFATPSRCPAGKLHTSKHAITAADLLNDRVLPWYEEHSIRLLRILTDRGTEYNGSIENHEYQLYLAGVPSANQWHLRTLP